MEEVMVVKGNGWRCESRLLGFAPRRFLPYARKGQQDSGRAF